MPISSDDTPSGPRQNGAGKNRGTDHGRSPGQSPEELERVAAWKRGEERERRLAEDPSEVRESVRKVRSSAAAEAFTALADNVRDYAIFLMNADGIITFWGEGARLIKWWTKEQAEGGHLRLLYPPEGSEDGTAEDHLRLAAERGEYTGEGQRIRSDGSTFWGGITLTALRDAAGELVGFAKVTRDLTARRAADALLQSAAASAEAAIADAVAASNAKSGFLATMSHEIRTPVNAIIGYHELLDLEIDGPLTEGQRRHLSRAMASSRHLLGLITEVLDFSRIEANQAIIREHAFRIGDAVSGALGLVSPQARQRGVEISNAVSGYAGGLAAWGDEAHVRQILVNLLANAIKFTEPRGPAPGRITVSAGTATQASPEAQLEGEGPWIYLRIEDTGEGIPDDRLQAIFEPFVQADMTLTRTHGGTGLGLAISRRLARLMGGDVTGRSEMGIGSTFFVWLPAAPVKSLETGGLEGHGPGREQGYVSPNPDMDGSSNSLSYPFRAIADAVLAELEQLLRVYVSRLRSDPKTPSAHTAPEAAVEDQLASFLADLASTLTQLDGSPGRETAGIEDATAVQRVVSERHGAQRARLGWTESELRREFEILGEEIAAAVRRHAPDRMRGPVAEARENEAERSLEVLTQFMGIALRLTVESFRNYKEERDLAEAGEMSG